MKLCACFEVAHVSFFQYIIITSVDIQFEGAAAWMKIKLLWSTMLDGGGNSARFSLHKFMCFGTFQIICDGVCFYLRKNKNRYSQCVIFSPFGSVSDLLVEVITVCHSGGMKVNSLYLLLKLLVFFCVCVWVPYFFSHKKVDNINYLFTHPAGTKLLQKSWFSGQLRNASSVFTLHPVLVCTTPGSY